MRSRRVLLVLLLGFAFDAAVPYEPAARAGFELEIEDQGEEAVHAQRRRAEAPAPGDVRPEPPPAGSTTGSPSRATLVASAGRAAARASLAGKVRGRPDAPRARTHAPDSAASAEDH